MSDQSGFVVCFRKCWPCAFGQCPGGWHTWADADDVSHAAETGQRDPRQLGCDCLCTDGPDLNPEPERKHPGRITGASWVNKCLAEAAYCVCDIAWGHEILDHQCRDCGREWRDDE